MRRPKTEQAFFPDMATGQRRYVTPEARELYDAVEKLRKFGRRVWRAGRSHMVDGRIVDDLQLKALAAACVWR